MNKELNIEKAAGVILYRQGFDGMEFLTLRSSREKAQIEPKRFVDVFWDFPKGKIEHGETAEDAAKREVTEETGISDVEIMPDFLQKVQYIIYKEGKPVHKDVLMYLAQAPSPKVDLSREHSGFEWLNYDDAIRRITLPEMKKALRAAQSYLENI